MFESPPTRRGSLCRLALAMLAVSGTASFIAYAAEPPAPTMTLDETRLALGKWIETQQIITKERKDWQQGKEIVAARIELVEKEIADLESQIRESETKAADALKKHDELVKQTDDLKAEGKRLTEAVTGLEGDVRRLFKQLPAPLQERIVQGPLYNRIPVDPAKTNVAVAERYQNVIGILNEINKANGEITVSLEVLDAAQVNVIYIGLAQAYYVGGTGAAGVSRPTPDGWKPEPLKSISGDVLKTLEIIQGKQTPAFVPLPVKIQ